MTDAADDFAAECLRERGRVLTGRYAHFCDDWDGLTMDETCDEWPCVHAAELRFREVLAKIPDVPPVPGDEIE